MMMMGFRKTSRAQTARTNRLFPDAMGANVGMERYILGDVNGRYRDAYDKRYYLVRKDDNSPPESLLWSGIGTFEARAGVGVLVGWWNGERCIIGPDNQQSIAVGRNPNVQNTGEAAVWGWQSKAGLPDLVCKAIGTQNTPSMSVLVYPHLFVDETYTARSFAGAQADLTSSIPSSGEHRLALVALKADLSLQVTTSTAQSAAFNFDVTDVQECLTSLAPRAIPVATYRLYGGQTRLSESDKHADLREWVNQRSSRRNLSASTAPAVTDDSGDGYGIGSLWIDTTLDKGYLCLDDTVGAAVWFELGSGSGGVLNNYAGTVQPTATDDSGDGYSVGSVWMLYGATYRCAVATVGAAQWVAQQLPLVATGSLLVPQAHQQIIIREIDITGTLDIQGELAVLEGGDTIAGLQRSITSVSVNTTLTANHYTVLVSGTTTITLPAAASHNKRIYNIKNVGVGTVTIDANASETIDGSLTQVLSLSNSNLTIQCDGTGWYIL